MEFTLKKFFGYSTFRPYQKEIISEILNGRDCLVLMATGSGKSLCYQVPPLIVGKTGIVISPLISLMQDQVMSLKQLGIKAEFLSSAQTDSSVQSKAQSGDFNILFMTPEKACSIPTSFWSKLLKVGICLLAIDEAHCISEWGHDFRVEYKQLDKLRDILLDVPFVGLTATATEKVRIDITNSLKMRDPFVTVGSFDRKNLFYGVKSFNRGSLFADELVGEISKFVTVGSTIVYCTTIKDVEQIFEALQEAGIKAGMYHSQMSNRAREESHRLFLRDELNVMVATIAFGMGIDKPNIRHVIHYGCPKSVESYYQESGRCGRDGIASVCWLYYTRSDFAKADFYCGESHTEIQRSAVRASLMAAQRYCFLTTCRRKFLLQHFGEQSSYDNCGNCDNCTSSKRERDLSREAYLLMACIQSCGGHWGLNLPIDVLRGSRAKKILDARFDKLPLHGLGKDYPSNWWKELGYVLISQGYLQEIVKDVFKLVRVSPKGLQFLSSSRSDHQPPLLLPETSGMLDVMECKKASGGVEDDRSLVTLESEGFSEAEAKLYHMLLEERMKLARGIGTAPHAVCGDQTIKKIALARPSTKARLSNIDGVNQYLVATHGDHLLQTIRHLSQGLNLSLDGYEDVSIQNATTKKVYAGPNQEGKVAPVFSEAEGQLIQLLLEERMKIARGTGTSPHAICDDQTIRKIALTRPSTKARLANIDGVNQQLVASHGEHLLQTIKDLSQKLNLSLAGHGVSSIKTVTPRKVNQEGKIAPAKYEAWKMWNEGLPFKRIANHPSRGAPIKEETVINYILNAAQEGLSVDWARLCDEVGMTRQIFSEIQAAISRIGSRDKLKPIKEELPEHISYVHIRVYLTMVDCGMSVDSIPPSHYDTVDEEPCEVETTVEAAAELTPVSVNDDDPLSSRKRQKIDGPEEESSKALEATETSILDLLKNYEDGVSLSDIVEHFKGSKEERVVNLLECLEGDFLIFKKKNRYRLM